jgi:hypothetical protein
MSPPPGQVAARYHRRIISSLAEHAHSLVVSVPRYQIGQHPQKPLAFSGDPEVLTPIAFSRPAFRSIELVIG